MVVERNVSGLRHNAQKKRQEAFEKVEQGIQKLIKEQQVINFNTVAKASGVSKAWLYKESEIKSRIEHLREKHSKGKKTPPKQRASDASKNAIINTLKARVKKAEGENRELKKQIEVAYGRTLAIPEMEQAIEKLEEENQRLKKELQECRLQCSQGSESKVTPILKNKGQGEISEKIKDELNELGIKLSTTLARKIKKVSESVTLTAIEALKEQMTHQVIRSPGGWLASAIDEAWEPNEAIGEAQSGDSFAQWYDLAREVGIVTGSRKEEDGSISVRDTTGEWISYETFSSKWKIEYLRARVAR